MMKFLVPVDFTEITNPLLRLVKILAQAHSAKVALLHVVSPVLYLPYPESFGMSVIDLELLSDLEKRKEEEAKERLSGLADFLKPIPVELMIDMGDPAELILEKEQSFDLIIMASHRKSLIEKILVGSTAEKVARYTKKPLLVLKGREVENFKKVVIAHDLSKYADLAFEFAIKLLKPFNPQTTILHVEETIELPVVANIKDVISERYREEKIKYLESLKEKARAEGFTTQVKVIEGKNPADAVLEYLKNNTDVDLIVMGNRGLSTLQRVLLGSTSSEVLKKAELPVLIHRSVQ
ncbi:universal stress protein [Hydrogenobacter hydrogenophilus]|uniref:Nucleotide-binding universal stress protein, UspA family n=1 Tax=Hydrogenobacter hydrogenophilus TaxID=35835 RepID=A0A285P2A7_9AQUI|nr:universal stress protein [Hydrogenobacter hydrogenophilus]SNZ14011.1 Nucleotide-binding universal stress protein, UspA family [Hydrogenobacter hydrogenophilus]